MKPMHCPNCGGALPAHALKNDIASCEYCGTSFRLSSTVTPEPTMGDLLLGADFRSRTLPGWELMNKDMLTFVESDPPELHGEFAAKKTGAYYMLKSSGLLDDFDVSMSIKFTSGRKENVRAGVYPRLTTNGGYGFLISVQASYTFGYFEKDDKNGGLTWNPLLPWTYHTALQEGFGVYNRLRVVCAGEAFRVYLNGVLAGSFKDDRFALGQLYLAVEPGGQQAGGFSFADLQVREAPEG